MRSRKISKNHATSFLILACQYSRRELGLPEDWIRINNWLHHKKTTVVPIVIIKDIKLKNPEIPILANYKTNPIPDFWETFPHKNLPNEPATKIDICKLEKLVEERKDIVTTFVWARARKSISYLRHGGPAFQTNHLPPCTVKNSKAAFENGSHITDSICTWIKRGYVSGPFSSPPLKDFRVNSILAVPQPGKIRICMNVSLPEGNSFNDNIAKHSMEKMHMSSAKSFGFSVLEAGEGACMSKFDFIDAYKNVPAAKSDLRLQGFTWLGKYFVEDNMTFGGKPSVQNFDVMGATAKDLTLAICKIPSKLVHRQLDDVPLVAPKKTQWCQEFSTKYSQTCQDLNMKLAPNCPDNDKAFTCQTWGKVLGIIFDTNTLTWELPEMKRFKTLKAIKKARENDVVSLKEMQKLMGRLNHVSQMCPFLNGFRHCLNSDLAKATTQHPKPIILSVFSKKDLQVWSNFLTDPTKRIPLAHRRESPPLCTKLFVSDSAGFAPNSKWDGEVGCGVVGTNENSRQVSTQSAGFLARRRTCFPVPA